MKQIIKQNPIIHWNLAINKLSNYQKGLEKNTPADLLIEETKIIIQ